MAAALSICEICDKKVMPSSADRTCALPTMYKTSIESFMFQESNVYELP